jgi:hypothetical protein
LKTNVRQVEGALDKLERIRGVGFEWAETESPYALGGVPGEPGLGVVAQEVEEVFPEVVSTYAGPDQEDTDQEDTAQEYTDQEGFKAVVLWPDQRPDRGRQGTEGAERGVAVAD